MIDSQGNTVTTAKNGVITLHLAASDSNRKIGVLYKDFIYVTRNRTRHQYRKNKSYGFNEFLTAFPVKSIKLKDEFGTYLIPIDIIRNGTILAYLDKGYERQLTVPINIIEKYKQ